MEDAMNEVVKGVGAGVAVGLGALAMVAAAVSKPPQPEPDYVWRRAPARVIAPAPVPAAQSLAPSDAPAPVAAKPPTDVPAGPFKRVDATYLANLSKHGTDAHNVEFFASCSRPKNWAVVCTEISDNGQFVSVYGRAVSGVTAPLDGCELGKRGCTFKVRFTFTGRLRKDILMKAADMTVPNMVVPADHVILEHDP
jgi:hypothetical protein